MGDQIYTIYELRCWKVENLDNERSDETKNEGGATGLVFSACKLNLPLAPSQDYVLQDNKRCYNKILSDWNFRPSSNDSGRLDEHEVMILDINFFF